MKVIRAIDSDDKIIWGSLLEDGSINKIEGDIFEEYTVSNQKVNIKKLLAPVKPTAIYCIGLNYRHHAKESGLDIPEYPVVFMKAPSAVQNPYDPIEIPQKLCSNQVDYECELAVVIKKKCKNIKKSEALDYVLGYTCANDISARDWQIAKGGSQWCRGKTFDTFAPIGPSIVFPDEIPDPNNLSIKTILNGNIVQDWKTNDMIFDVATIIEFLSSSTTLLPGTVILTGTPHGVGMACKPPRWLKPGDNIEVEIEKIGKLFNPVINEKILGKN